MWEPPEYDCSTPMREKGMSNKRGYWEVYTTTVPGDGNPVHIERTAVTKGATSVSDTTGLQKERYSYAYLKHDPADALADEQLELGTLRTSLLQTGADA